METSLQIIAIAVSSITTGASGARARDTIVKLQESCQQGSCQQEHSPEVSLAGRVRASSVRASKSTAPTSHLPAGLVPVGLVPAGFVPQDSGQQGSFYVAGRIRPPGPHLRAGSPCFRGP